MVEEEREESFLRSTWSPSSCEERQGRNGPWSNARDGPASRTPDIICRVPYWRCYGVWISSKCGEEGQERQITPLVAAFEISSCRSRFDRSAFFLFAAARTKEAQTFVIQTMRMLAKITTLLSLQQSSFRPGERWAAREVRFLKQPGSREHSDDPRTAVALVFSALRVRTPMERPVCSRLRRSIRPIWRPRGNVVERMYVL